MKVALVIGLATGAINGLVALGIVLVYKGARVFNFAQAEFGTVAAFAAWGALTKAHLPYGLAIVVGLAAAVAMGMAVERAIVRPLRARPPVTTLVATAGVALLCIGLELALGGARMRVFPPVPVTFNVSVMGVMLSTQRIIAILVVISLGLALAWFFSRTSLGLAVLATSQEAIAARLAGISIDHVSTFIWGSAALLGGIAGLLLAPINPFSPGFMTMGTLIPAFTAAVIGGLTSLPGAFVGGVLIGIAQGLGQQYLGSVIPGAPSVVVFGLLLTVLLIRPKGLFGAEV